MIASVTGQCVATRSVLTTTDEHPGDDQKDHDGHDNPKHLHPAWCAWLSIRGQPHVAVVAGIGIGRPVSYVRLLSSRVVVEAFVHEDKSLSRQYVFIKS